MSDMQQGMSVLVVGGGGREHALARSLAHSERVRQVFVAPGNAGTQWVADVGGGGGRGPGCRQQRYNRR